MNRMCTEFEKIKAAYLHVRELTRGVGALMYDPDEEDQCQLVIDEGRKGLKEAAEETAKLERLVRDHFTELSIEETTTLLALSTPILVNIEFIRNKVSDSSIAKEFQAEMEAFSEPISDFFELCDDLQVWNIDIKSDKELSRKLEEFGKILQEQAKPGSNPF